MNKSFLNRESFVYMLLGILIGGLGVWLFGFISHRQDRDFSKIVTSEESVPEHAVPDRCLPYGSQIHDDFSDGKIAPSKFEWIALIQIPHFLKRVPKEQALLNDFESITLRDHQDIDEILSALKNVGDGDTKEVIVHDNSDITVLVKGKLLNGDIVWFTVFLKGNNAAIQPPSSLGEWGSHRRQAPDEIVSYIKTHFPINTK